MAVRLLGRRRDWRIDAGLEGEAEVPSCWQTAGWEKPHYVNTQYPFPADPPHLPASNPLGVYRRTVRRPAGFQGRILLHFAGVSSAFSLYVNRGFAGYSQGSHLPAEFDLTDRLAEGDNELTVAVYKWCDGSYLEDQDMFRHNGIFRDVYLLFRPRTYLRDYRFAYREEETGRFACEVQAELEGEDAARLRCTLSAPDGRILYEGQGEAGETRFAFRVDPRSLVGGRPALYRLRLSWKPTAAAKRSARRLGSGRWTRREAFSGSTAPRQKSRGSTGTTAIPGSAIRRPSPTCARTSAS